MTNPAIDLAALSTAVPSAHDMLVRVAGLMASRTASALDDCLVSMVALSLMEHRSVLEDCRFRHEHTEGPCDDYERAQTLLLSWLLRELSDAEGR